MKRQEFVTIVGATVLAPKTAMAQLATKVHRIGLLAPAPAITDDSLFGATLIRALARHGQIQKETYVFERRGADGRLDLLPRLVEELVANKVDVIVSFS